MCASEKMKCPKFCNENGKFLDRRSVSIRPNIVTNEKSPVILTMGNFLWIRGMKMSKILSREQQIQSQTSRKIRSNILTIEKPPANVTIGNFLVLGENPFFAPGREPILF